MYPVRNPSMEVKNKENGAPFFRKYDPSGNEFNVLMIMLDSVSHACAQRYIPKTYKMFNENPYTTIMQVKEFYSDIYILVRNKMRFAIDDITLWFYAKHFGITWGL